MGYLLKRNGQKYKSVTMIADDQHLMTDAWSSAGLVLGLFVVWIFQVQWLDNVVAIIFALFFIYVGIRIIRGSVSGVMDETDIPLVKEGIGIFRDYRNENWIDVHNMRIIRYGSNIHVDCHMTMPWYWELKMMHHELDIIEDAISKRIGHRVELFIHVDPCVPVQYHICNKSDCAVRQHSFKQKVEWTLDTVMKNKRHGYGEGWQL